MIVSTARKLSRFKERKKRDIDIKILCFTSLFLTFMSCSSGPQALPLELPSEALEKAKEDASRSGLIVESTEWIADDWWRLFNDSQLNVFIETAFARNPTLQEAHTNILLASYNADKIRSVLFPYIALGADVSRQKLSETAIIPFNPTGQVPGAPFQAATGGVGGIPVYFTQYESEFTLTYDFDIWGKNRNTLRAAIGEVQADIADEAFSRLQLGISVAKVYFQLQIDYKRQEIAESLVQNKSEYQKYIQHRLLSNVENALTLNTAEFNLADVTQQLLRIRGDIAVKENQLKSYLAGNFEEEILNIEIAEKLLPKVPMPQDLPLHLIAHRPDIMAQLWLIESAGRQIDVARAGFYPDFNLSAFFGFQTIHLQELFNWKSCYFDVDPAFTLPIFDAGRLHANLRGSETNYDLAILRYNELVLDAAREVLDGIAVLRNSEQQLTEYNKKTQFQNQVYELTRLRMTNNLNSRLDLLVSLQNLLLAQDQEIVALGNVIQAVLSLIKALGGGYEAC